MIDLSRALEKEFENFAVAQAVSQFATAMIVTGARGVYVCKCSQRNLCCRALCIELRRGHVDRRNFRQTRRTVGNAWQTIR